MPGGGVSDPRGLALVKHGAVKAYAQLDDAPARAALLAPREAELTSLAPSHLGRENLAGCQDDRGTGLLGLRPNHGLFGEEMFGAGRCRGGDAPSYAQRYRDTREQTERRSGKHSKHCNGFVGADSSLF